MRVRGSWTLPATAGLCAVLTAGSVTAQRAAVSGLEVEPPLASSHAQTAPAPAAISATPDEVVQLYCARCHNDELRRGELSLESFTVAQAVERAAVAEKMIRKLQAGLMPPPGSRRPDAASLAGLITALETPLDQTYAARPRAGVRPFPRLNRVEYARAIKGLLALDVDAGAWLPLDAKSANFDNIADEQMLSATLLESYLNAAADISRLAVGDRDAPPVDKTYTNPVYLSQHPWDHVAGAPYGTRGGIVVDHIFPADAEYSFVLTFISGNNTRFEDIDVSIDGERVALIKYENGAPVGADGRGGVPIRTPPIVVRAGQHRVAAAFVRRIDGPYEDLIRPHDWSYSGGGDGGAGITTLPHLRELIVRGPNRVSGVSETESRRRIFTCRPTSAGDERPCAERIVTSLATAAYRRPVAAREVASLMQFYEIGAADKGFEEGVRRALEAVLASPHFIFRIEPEPAGVRPGEPYALDDVALASRLSFFLWGAPPDDTLLDLAARGELSKPDVLASQARRLLADARSEALAGRFAAQWLRLQDLDKVKPDPNYYPNFDDNLAAAMRQETLAFFTHLVREDRSVLDLYRADYTFANERLARHYGLPGVSGTAFRKVAYPDDTRRGLLGHGSVLVQTSMANRTSPVLRGKWVMEVLLGTPPPPPPPLIPALEEAGEVKDGRMLTTREKLEIHRADPTCNACHRFMDPIGLALDRFDVTGRWREREAGMPLDTHGDFYDGTPVSTPAELSAALLRRPVPLVRTFTENLLSYALGRRVEHFDQPAVRAIARAAETQDYRLSSFVIGVVTSVPFRMKEGGEEPPTAGGRRGLSLIGDSRD
jgi:hypothetical protein